jgi:hypothetical protein
MTLYWTQWNKKLGAPLLDADHKTERKFENGQKLGTRMKVNQIDLAREHLQTTCIIHRYV